MIDYCVIANKYPNPVTPNELVFVQQLVWSLADKGKKCAVICPVPVNIYPRLMALPEKTSETTENGNEVEVFFPRYLGFGQQNILGKNTIKLTTFFFSRVINKTIKKMESVPIVVYGHFLAPAGVAAASAGRRFSIPAFLAYGEATPKTILQFGACDLKKELSSIQGIVSVSSENKDRLVTLDVAAVQKIGIFPNGYRRERFYSEDKRISREKFGFPEDAFIVGMVGSFDNRKGITRLEQAVDMLDDVFFVCAGSGELKPQSLRCLYAKPVNNKDLRYFYSALDVFVLPTLKEGCCNAIIEAMACGCPVVSSDLPFNDDLLDENCSIRIDPNNVNEIAAAIQKLKDYGALRNTLSSGCLNKAKTLTLDSRAERIISFVEETNEKSRALHML